MGAVAIIAAFAIDGGISIWQQRVRQQQRQAWLLLGPARSSLYVELTRIVQVGRASLPHDGDTESMRRVLYIMLNAVRHYVQTARTGRGAASAGRRGKRRGVVKLTDAYA